MRILFTGLCLLGLLAGCSNLPRFTATPAPSPTPTLLAVDPHLELEITQTELRVCDVITLTARVVDIGLPYYYLIFQDENKTETVNPVSVTYSNEITWKDRGSQVIEVRSASGGQNEAVFTLEGIKPGETDVWVSATGEVHSGYPGPATWSGGGSDPIHLTVLT